MKKITCILLCVFYFSVNIFSQNAYKDYEDGGIYFKLKDNVNFNMRSVQDKINLEDAVFLKDIQKSYSINQLRKPFYLTSSSILQRTYKISFSNYQDVDKIIDALYQTGVVEYAEKVPLLELANVPNDILYTPNDPFYATKQWSLAQVNAPKAWNYSKGSKKIVIAVIDNAVSISHVDLKANLWVNPKEIPGNGKDDDNNGYIDDINGWDMANNDNDPSPDNSVDDHGTHTSGIAAAVSDNNIGIASLSFGVSLMAIKAGATTDIYKGITYAANAGANVISISFSSNGSAQTDQNVVTYAYSKGVTIVVAAGNNSSETKTYPAAYTGVIAVASTDKVDKKPAYSSYGTWVDISAPGEDIYSTIPGNGYVSMGGTSMACPLVASLCGLMLSLNPALTQAQLESCLKSSAVNIDALNPTYAGKMGAGRIDAEAALKCVSGLMTSAEEKSLENGIHIYPNPTKGAFVIESELQNTSSMQLELRDIMGQKVISTFKNINGTSNTQVDISHLPSGIYFLNLKSGQESYTRKIVKE